MDYLKRAQAENERKEREEAERKMMAQRPQQMPPTFMWGSSVATHSMTNGGTVIYYSPSR